MNAEVGDAPERRSILKRIVRFGSAPRTRRRLIRDFSFIVGVLSAGVFAVTAGLPLLRGVRPVEAGANMFFGGLVTLGLGLIMSYGWLGEKEDYSRTGYVVRVRGMGFIYARTNPGPKPSEQEREQRKSAGVIVNLFGLAFITAGVLLMASSVFLGLGIVVRSSPTRSTS